jgi:hypothetical protein
MSTALHTSGVPAAGHGARGSRRNHAHLRSPSRAMVALSRMNSAPSVELRRFTRDEFLRMIEWGLFHADEHLELLHGRLIVLPPPGPPDAYASSILRDRLLAAYTGGASVREDKPLDCG